MFDRFIRVSAYVLVVEHGKLLLCRCSNQSDDPGKWTLPGGGLEFGEDPQVGAGREFLEETGIEVEIDRLAGIDSLALPENSSRGAVHAIRIIYFGRIVGGELRPELEGSTDLPAWFSRDELADLPLVELATYGVQLAF